MRDRLDGIRRIEIATQESAIRIISKVGPLRNPADRDHCLQYIVAVGLLRAELTAADYEDAAAAEALPLLLEKLERNLRSHLPADQSRQVLDMSLDHARLCATPVTDFMHMLAKRT